MGTSVRAADASCLNAPVTPDELHDCIKRLLAYCLKWSRIVVKLRTAVFSDLSLVNYFPKLFI